MIRKGIKNKARQKRHLRVRKAITGTAARPRLNVFRSLSNIYAQIIDDVTGTTLANGYGGNTEAAKVVGAAVATRALAKGISKVVFDRGGYIYHGRVAALAQAAREAGLEF